MNPLSSLADEARLALHFLPLESTAALARDGILVLDPASTLVSDGVALGRGVVLWPGTVLQRLGNGRIAVGDGTILFPGTRIVAEDGGTVTIGAQAEIGEEGGFTIKAQAEAEISIGAGARLLGGGSLVLSNRIGRGAQILGPIRCQACRLGDGDTWRDPDPDRRGGVLKGSGVARDVDIPQGRVIQAFGLFAEAEIRPQSFFHPKAGS
jgi:carbonic anhydrase/acetyltransferase-like protein (isoleucine patch superfamily)